MSNMRYINEVLSLCNEAPFSADETQKEMAKSFEKMEAKERQGFVYFILAKGVGMVKIGWSKDPFARLRDLSTSSPHPLRLLFSFAGTMQKERDLHLLFRRSRANGEWFYFSNEIEKFIEGLVWGEALRRTLLCAYKSSGNPEFLHQMQTRLPRKFQTLDNLLDLPLVSLSLPLQPEEMILCAGFVLGDAILGLWRNDQWLQVYAPAVDTCVRRWLAEERDRQEDAGYCVVEDGDIEVWWDEACWESGMVVLRRPKGLNHMRDTICIVVHMMRMACYRWTFEGAFGLTGSEWNPNWIHPELIEISDSQSPATCEDWEALAFGVNR